MASLPERPPSPSPFHAAATAVTSCEPGRLPRWWPALLLSAGLRDPRVPAWIPARYAALLQRLLLAPQASERGEPVAGVSFSVMRWHDAYEEFLKRQCWLGHN
jgi:hypothetical protein